MKVTVSLSSEIKLFDRVKCVIFLNNMQYCSVTGPCFGEKLPIHKERHKTCNIRGNAGAKTQYQA